MKFKYFLCVIWFILLILSGPNVYAGNNSEFKSDFEKIELDYKKGDYKVAQYRVNVLLKKIEKKYGKENMDISRAYALQAKVSCALGNFSDYSKEVTLSINTLNHASKDDTVNYINTLLDISKAYVQYGDYLNAEKYARETVEMANGLNSGNSDFIIDLKVHYAKVLFHQGYLLQAQILTSEICEFYKKRLVKKEEFNNPKTGLVEVEKVSSKELRVRRREFADIINFYAKSLIEDGEYQKADSVLIAHNKWIKKNLGKREITYVDNLVLSARLANELSKRKERYLYLDKASRLAGKTKGVKLKPGSNQMLTIYLDLIPSYKDVGKNRSAGKKRNQLAARIIRYYGKDNIWYGKYMMLEAKQHLDEGSWKKAEDRFENILQNPFYFPEVKLERATVLVWLKEAELKMDKYQEAEKNLQEAIDIKKALMGEKAPVYHMQLLDMADFHVQYTSKFKVAEEIYVTSLWKVIDKEIGHNHKNYVNYLYNESRLYEFTDRFRKADNIIKKANAEIERYYGKTQYQYAVALERQANLDIHLGRYFEAEEGLKKALEILEKNNIPVTAKYLEKTLETYARLNIIQGQYSEAERNLKKANRLSKKHGSDNTELTNAVEELATLYIHIGKYQSTEKSLKESLKRKEEKFGINHRSLINPLNQLGHLYLITGDYTTAEKMVNRALTISKGIFGDTSVKFAESLMLLQKIYSAIGDYVKAEEAGIKVVEIETNQLGRNHLLVANALNDLALSKFLNKQKKEEVEPLFLESLQIIKNNLSDQHLQYAEVLKNLSLFYIESGRTTEAEENLEKANKIYVSKLGVDNLQTAEIYFLKAGLHAGKGEYTQALDLFNRSKDIYARKFDTDHPGYVKALSKVAHMYYILGDLKNSVKTVNETTKKYLTFIDKYFPSLSEREKNRFWNLISNDFEFYSSLTARLKDENPELIGNLYNFALATKALLLNSSIKVRERILNSQDTILINKYEDWLAKKELLTSVLSMSLEQRKEEGLDIKILEKEIEQLEKSISEYSHLFAENYERKTNYDWKEIRKNLLPNEVAVEIIRFRYFDKGFSDSIIYAALIVTPESKLSPDLVLLGDGVQLEGKYGRYYRNCIKFDVEDRHSYTAFWKPLTKYLKENTKVYFSPDGIYNQLNLETIPLPDNGYIIDKYEIVLVNNSKDIISNKIALAQKRKTAVNTEDLQATLFGNPTYYTIDPNGKRIISNKLSQLPGAEKEVKNLHGLLNDKGWNATVYLNDEASEEKLKDLESPYVFHIATHGFFLEDVTSDADYGLDESKAIQNPLLRSGLLLKNGGKLIHNDNIYELNAEEGVLTAYEAMNLNFDNTDLVVLSACETGLGEVQLGEGVYGLQRAFLVAGANSVVMSLFKVSDEVTTELMSEFYKKWLQSGDKRKAFIEAKKAIKEKYKNPIYWGAFVMVGLDK